MQPRWMITMRRILHCGFDHLFGYEFTSSSHDTGVIAIRLIASFPANESS
jgi:hypothetical protein